MFKYIHKCLATIVLVATIGVAVNAQSNITAIEYFFDTDPGFNFGIPVAVPSPATDLINVPISINVSALSTGMHTFYVRTKNATNLWSLTNWSKVYKEFLYPNPAATGPIRRLEYFIDTDPGFGNATPVGIPASQTEIANLAFTVDLSAVPAGTHRFYIRTLDDEWGLTNVVLFTTNTVLPVKLLNFSVKKERMTATATWQTSFEQNNAGFDVERSSNGIDFVKTGYVNGKGNSSTRQDYSFKDLQPGQGISYYRLRQIDLDGRSALSEIRTVDFTGEEVVPLRLFPNPATQFIQLQLPSEFFGQQANISIADGTGRIVKQWMINSAQLSVLTLPITELPAGMWRLIISTKTRTASGSFTK